MVLVVGGMNQGKYVFAKTISEDVVKDLHMEIRSCMERGENPWALAEQVQLSHPNGVITVAELGCGLIPVDAFDREYRETVGRISCELAKKADAVYRVCCGIPMQIK
ncbi:MAG: bifunctional adenosylcobinamide kinase/adenosylcobinamide-phosphate guanylyltransferase [Lachnospiraceae bacterium]|nr:bifunctional adenosylcobinamide kinase/adenosylcobinamide-phosphate guanylyltransferase [Lachnospiraceae bacterium]